MSKYPDFSPIAKIDNLTINLVLYCFAFFNWTFYPFKTLCRGKITKTDRINTFFSFVLQSGMGNTEF